MRSHILQYILLLTLLAIPLAHAAEPGLNQELQLVVDADGFNGSPIECLGISSDGRWLAAASNKVVRVWNLKTGKQLPALRGYQEPYGFDVGTINALTFSPDGRFLLIGVTDNTEAGSTRVYDLSQDAAFHSLVEGHLGCTRGVAFSPSGNYLATWGCDGQIIVLRWSGNGAATKIFSTDWSMPTGLSENENRRVQSLQPQMEQVMAASRERRFSEAVGKLDSVLAQVRSILGKDHELVLNLTTGLIKMLEDSGNSQRAESVRRELAELNSLVKGGCFGFVDEETLVFSHCGAIKVVSVAKERNLFHDEFPPIITKIKSSQTLINQSLKLKQLKAMNGNTYDLAALKSGRGTWYATGFTEQKGQEYTFHVDAWNANSTTAISHSHSFDPVAVTFNVQAGLAASSDRLGTIHVWKLQDGQQVGKSLEPNSLRLWNVAWDQESLYFADESYSQKDFNFNHRGPISKKLDLRQMAIINAAKQVEPVVESEIHQGNTLLRLQQLAVPPNKQPDLYLVINNQRWTVASGERSQAKNRPLRTIPPALNAWSYCFVRYPGCDDRPHLLVGSETGTLVELAMNATSSGVEFELIRTFFGHTGAISSIAVAPDSRRFATSSLDGTVRIWVLDQPRVLADLACLTDGSRVYATADDAIKTNDVLQRFGNYTYFERIKPILRGEFSVGQSVDLQITRRDFTRLGDIDVARSLNKVETRTTLERAPDMVEPVLSVFLSQDGEWVVWNSQGFYNASPNGARHLGFHRNRQRHLPAEFYTSEQYRDFYRPSLVLDGFKSGNTPDVAPALFEVASLQKEDKNPKSILVTDDFEEAVPPVVKIKQTQLDPKNAEGSCRIEIEVGIPVKRRMRDVTVTFDQMSVPVRRLPDSERTTDGLKFVTYVATPALDPGRYLVSAEAEHDFARSKSSSLTVDIAGASPKPLSAVKPNLYVLSIGIGQYKTSELNIDLAAQEAQSVADLFKAEASEGFDKVECKVLTDEQCTRQAFLQGFEWLQKSATRTSDLAVVFVNAHAIPDEFNVWYFLPVDARPENLRVDALQTRDVLDQVERIPRAILLLDVFHRSLPQQSYGQNPFQDSNKAVVLACAQSSTSTSGVFGDAVVDVLKSQSKKPIKFDSFVQQLRKQIMRRTNSQQTPIQIVHDKSHNGYAILN